MRISRGALAHGSQLDCRARAAHRRLLHVQQLWQAGRRAPGRSSGSRAAQVAVHRRAGRRSSPGTDLQDRQRAAGKAADRADEGRHRLRAAGRGRAQPDHGGVLLAHPAGGRAGAQLARGGHQAAAAVRPASVRVLRRSAAPAAGRRAGRIVDLYDGHRRRLFPCSAPRSRRTTCTPRRRRCSREAKGASKARDIGFRFGGSARRQPDARVQRQVPGRGL